MPGKQVFVFPQNNELTSSDTELTASVETSTKQTLVYPNPNKTGNGILSIVGDYTGSDDATYDIQIVDEESSDITVATTPKFSGAGNGTLSNLWVNDLESQDVEIICQDVGTETTYAKIEIEGLQFKAKTAGTTGNNIYISVDETPLTLTQTNYSLLKELAAESQGITGYEYDWDVPTMLADDIFPDDAFRFCFNEDLLHIYRMCKKWEDGEWHYYFNPGIEVNVPANAVVYEVIGGRTITIGESSGDDGGVGTTTTTTAADNTETYTDIKTIADFWDAVKASSNLIEPVDGAINRVAKAGSPVLQEFRQRTTDYYLLPYSEDASITDANKDTLLSDIYVSDGVATELIRIECSDDSINGKERWKLSGSVSGDLGYTKTGQVTNLTGVQFTIPELFSFASVANSYTYDFDLVAREDDEDPPFICFAAQLGIGATTAENLTLTYVKRTIGCNCPSVKFNSDCLGVEGGESMATTIIDLVAYTNMYFEYLRETATGYFLIKKTYTAVATTPVEVTYYLLPSDSVDEVATIFPHTYTDSAGNISEYTIIGKESGEAAFEKWQSKYSSLFTTLANRIMSLSDDDATELSGISDDYKNLLATIQMEIGGITAANNDWQAYLVNVSPAASVGDLTASLAGSYTKPTAGITYDTDDFKDLWERVLEYEMNYSKKKSSVIDDSCYIDSTAEYYWAIAGGSKPYLPAFTDVEYYSSYEYYDSVTGLTYIVGDRAFAFKITVPCGGELKEGDTIIFKFGEAVTKPYNKGNIIYLPTISASNLELAGGIDGNDIYTFSVELDDLSNLPDYEVDRNTPIPYSHENIRFLITPGAVDFSEGDKFYFSIENGHWRWRKNGGTWSSDTEINTEMTTLDSGLSVLFEKGSNPSFVSGDSWIIYAYQDNKVDNVFDISLNNKWSGTGTLTIDLGSAKTIDCIVIDDHDIEPYDTEGGSTSSTSSEESIGYILLQASDYNDFSIIKLTETIYTSNETIYATFESTDARYWRILLGTGVSSYIGYCFLGKKWQFNFDAEFTRIIKDYAMVRTSTYKEPFSLFKHKKTGYELQWSMITYEELSEFDEFASYLKESNDMPFYFLINEDEEDNVIRARIDDDSIAYESEVTENADTSNRLYGLNLKINKV